MIMELQGLTGTSANGKPLMRTGDKSPQRCGYELLAWAVLEQAVDYLVTFARYGVIAPDGSCRPWPSKKERRIKKTLHGYEYYQCTTRANIACTTNPYEHWDLRTWFLSAEAETFCDLIGCKLAPAEIYHTTVKNHSGGKR